MSELVPTWLPQRERPETSSLVCEEKGPGPIESPTLCPRKMSLVRQVKAEMGGWLFLAISEPTSASLRQIYFSHSFSVTKPKFSKNLLFLDTKVQS